MMKKINKILYKKFTKLNQHILIINVECLIKNMVRFIL